MDEPDVPLSLHNEFSMLDLTDLLLARDRNHIELMRNPHVLGTAVGLYLIRKSDPWPRKNSNRPRGYKERPARTLQNSEVRDYSWPCIMAFVDDWAVKRQLPEALYLDEKRKVPVCVVYAPKQDSPDVPMEPVVYPSNRIGGGFPVIAEVQGREHLASVGCMLRDGHFVYALTNRHVTGPAGEVVYGRLGGQQARIGVSSSKQLTRLPFHKLYPDFAGKETYANLDIGLIKIDNINHWTADVFGIGTMGPLADLGMDNLSLRLIDCPVRAYGCGSGPMSGQIKALFYKYKSLGGFDYVADFLIGPRRGADLGTRPGDSGTVWLLESPKQGLMPIAVQWGGQVFSDGRSRQQSSYALATCLSTVCNLLDVDVIRDWNTGVTEYWGEVGHFLVGALACTLTFTGLPNLKRLMSRNIKQVGFEPEIIKVSNKVRRNVAHFAFVPLADVADDVWRMSRASGGETGDDGNNHFADMDQPAQSGKFKGKTLLQLCEDDANVDPEVWDEFYKGVPGTRPGALPFRVWQGYDLMVQALRAKDARTFLNVGGCMAHYVGDACQPLHISRLHHNDKNHQTKTGKDVHSVYETRMLNDNSKDIVEGVEKALKGKSVSGSFSGGHGAAVRVIKLMRDTVDALPPADIVAAYNDPTLKNEDVRVQRLWNDFGQATIDRLADGCICLADIWASAWEEGDGDHNIPQSALVAQDQQLLSDDYHKPDFYPSMSLHKMIDLLKGGGTSVAPAATPSARRRAGKATTRRRPAAAKKTARKSLPAPRRRAAKNAARKRAGRVSART